MPAKEPEGRIPSYCSATCKQGAYLARKYHGPMALLEQDIMTARVRAILRQEIRDIVMPLFRQFGLEPELKPPAKPKRGRQHLRLVKGKG